MGIRSLGGQTGPDGKPASVFYDVWGSSGLEAVGGVAFSASGGTKIPSGGYMYHVFSFPNSDNFVVSSGSKSVEILVVAGGGGGATQHGAGGGAGGVLHHPALSVSAGTYPVTVGDGGAGALSGPGPGNGTATYSASGGNSYFGPPSSPAGLTADGGGGAFPLGRSGSSGTQPLVYQNAPPTSDPYQGAGLPGGSGGSSGDEPGKPGGAATQTPMNGATGYGNAGQDATGAPTYNAGGGGGAGNTSPTEGKGGNGEPFTNFPAPVISPGVPSPEQAAFESAVGPTGLFGGGGGRGSEGSGNQQPGGPGGGGDGASGSNPGTNGGAAIYGTGGGGGGSSGYGATGGSGGSGIVVIRYSN
tara:strand:- start:2246 stop:3319 length:1074 start_codon:yes stop_codon:yes gene_type:complete